MKIRERFSVINADIVVFICRLQLKSVSLLISLLAISFILCIKYKTFYFTPFSVGLEPKANQI